MRGVRLVGGWPTELEIGQQVKLYDRMGRTPATTLPARVVASSTREDYFEQQRRRGRLEWELEQPWSIANTAKHFYLVEVEDVDTDVACPGCGVAVRWTGIYGPWCRDCYPRDLRRSRRRR